MKTKKRALEKGNAVVKYKIGAYAVAEFRMEKMIVPTEMRFRSGIV
jgi:hypothetical protein